MLSLDGPQFVKGLGGPPGSVITMVIFDKVLKVRVTWEEGPSAVELSSIIRLACGFVIEAFS